MKETKIFAIVNQKGGVGKTTVTINLGAALAARGCKILLLDMDPQASMTHGLGSPKPDNLKITISTYLEAALNFSAIDILSGITSHSENLDYIPANISLSECEGHIDKAHARENVLKRVLKYLYGKYDYILVDCPPTLGMLTANALAAASHVIIPTQAQYYSTLGMETLLRNINSIKNAVNEHLQIAGILMNMVDMRTILAREVVTAIRETYSNSLGVFRIEIPRSVRAEESAQYGQSVLQLTPDSKVSDAYHALAAEIIDQTLCGERSMAGIAAL